MSDGPAFDRDKFGQPWMPCSACPHPTPGACASRAHPGLCRRLASRPDYWRDRIAAMPAVHDEPATAPPGPPAFRRQPGRLNVLFVGNGYWPQGGTERWHQTLIPRLAALPDMHVMGYAVARECNGPPIAGRGGAPIPIASGYDAVRAGVALADVVVAWGLADLPAFLPAPLGGSPRRPRVIGVSHGSPDSAWNRDVVAGMAPVCDVRAACSAHAAGAWPGGAAGVAVVPNAVDPASMVPRRPRAAVRAALGLQPGEVACLAVGWVTEGKRLDLAASAVRRLGHPFRLFVAGDGHLHDRVKAAGGGRTVMLGRREDVADLMGAADLFVHPSISEGMALVHIEAQLAGLPIVSTPVGHLADERDFARIVPLDAGPAAWAAAIAADWREGTARRQRVVYARATAEAEYAADVFAARWAALLRSLSPVRDMPAPSVRPAASVAPRGGHGAGNGTLAVDRLTAARACDYRLPLSIPEQLACGCSGRGAAVCLLGKSRREDQRVSLGECVACAGAIA
jgi:glycosyltransferase involved in cell wall biosynthesis